MNNGDKSAPMAKICTINAVEGFDPAPLAVEYTDMNAKETRLRLPVMAQVAWFRLKYPEGRFTFDLKAENGVFVARARVYKNYMDPADCFLSEATASRGFLPEKPTVSPREWAQTAALGIALRNAGFGLQFHAAGESFDEPAVNELGALSGEPVALRTGAEPGTVPPPLPEPEKTGGVPRTDSPAASAAESAPASAAAEEDPLESAKKMPCPISKYKGKSLGDLIALDPGALVWVANKFSGDPVLNAAAKLICGHALEAAS